MGQGAAERSGLEDGAAAALVVRPERIRIVGAAEEVPAGANAVEATVVDALYLGSDRKYGLTLPDGQRAAVREQRDDEERQWQSGDAVRLTWSVDDGVLVADPAELRRDFGEVGQRTYGVFALTVRMIQTISRAAMTMRAMPTAVSMGTLLHRSDRVRLRRIISGDR